jgi:Protein of unknown function (DUF2950)
MHGRKIRFEEAFRGGLTATAAFAIFALLLAARPPFCLAQSSIPETFSSPEEASRALFAAVKHDDGQALMKILGAGKELVSLENKGQDKLEREEFVNKYQEMHRLVREPDHTTVLYIGAENWPFPVPLVSRKGTWSFDSKTGMREVLFRRIGENETKALEACHALAAAARQYEKEPRGDAADDPINALLASASNEGSANHQNESFRYHGYYFRILTGRKDNAPNGAHGEVSGGKTGFVFVAYPVEYRRSGVMTFIITDDDIIYQRDLGPNSAKLAKAMTTHTATSTWRPAD